jgi:ubiquinone/menaquinone biosynthesis C-methylase UbiE
MDERLARRKHCTIIRPQHCGHRAQIEEFEMAASEELDVDRAVRERYGNAANEREAALCCPIDYDPQYLAAIPNEVLERDYGCGDPSRYVRPGDTVLDLGSGGGKICFIASQIVGPDGRVLGVDVNDEMLSLARRSASEVAERIGHANVEFLRGRIQDLKLPLDDLDKWLASHPVQSTEDLASLESQVSRLRTEEPLIPDGTVDIVISNCVLNLVDSDHKRQLIEEIYRVLVRGGRIAISDIVSDEDVPEEMRNNPELWSGCISGAFKEDELLLELEQAGFYGIHMDVWTEEPFQVVDGIEFRSVTVTAHKGLEGPCIEGLQSVIYRGPWSAVKDDDDHVLRRGERTAVCEKTFEILSSAPYADSIIPVPARVEIPEHQRTEFDCSRTEPRHPQETKGADYELTTEASSCCEPGDSCC